MTHVQPMRILTAVVAGLVLLACGGSTDEGGTDPATVGASMTVVETPSPSATVDASPTSAAGGIAFPTNPLGDGLEALNRGELVAEGGCLWLVPTGEERLLIVWPLGYSWSADGGVVQVHDESGQVVARAGDRIEIGGHETGGSSPLPACPGRVWEATGPVEVLD